MSIVNVFMSAESALIGVDTEGTLPDGSHVEGCKMIFLPHLSAVVAFRGLDAVLACASPSIICYTGKFDDLAAVMKEIVLGAVRMATEHIGADRRNQACAANFVLVGYSPMAGRMVGHAYVKNPDSPAIDELRDFPQLYGPFFGVEEIEKLKIRADRAGMVALAMDQCRMVRERGPSDMPAGGRFLITEVRNGSISTEHVCNFPKRVDKDATQLRSGAM